MPKLLIFAPCDNVLLNQGAESASLIGIMSGITIPTPPVEFHGMSAVPMRWFIFCQWLIADEEFGTSFEQRLRIGQEPEYLNQISEFTGEAGKYHHRLIAWLNAFPIMPSGIHNIHVDLRVKGASEWSHVQSYPLEVNRI